MVSLNNHLHAIRWYGEVTIFFFLLTHVVDYSGKRENSSQCVLWRLLNSIHRTQNGYRTEACVLRVWVMACMPYTMLRNALDSIHNLQKLTTEKVLHGSCSRYDHSFMPSIWTRLKLNSLMVCFVFCVCEELPHGCSCIQRCLQVCSWEPRNLASI